MIYTPDTWKEFLQARDAGGIVEIDENIFDYFLEVLPPVWMNRKVKMRDGREQYTAFGFAEGWECVTVFWTKRDENNVKHFYCQLTNILNPYRLG